MPLLTDFSRSGSPKASEGQSRVSHQSRMRFPALLMCKALAPYGPRHGSCQPHHLHLFACVHSGMCKAAALAACGLCLSRVTHPLSGIRMGQVRWRRRAPETIIRALRAGRSFYIRMERRWVGGRLAAVRGGNISNN